MNTNIQGINSNNFTVGKGLKKHRLKLVLVLLIISLGINVSLLVIQSFYIPVYIFSMSQTEEYEEAIAQLNNATARFRTNTFEMRVFVYGEQDIYTCKRN